MNLDSLRGSTLNNPWVLSNRGRLVLASRLGEDGTELRRHSLPVSLAVVAGEPTRQLPRINKGPPSTIPHDFACVNKAPPSTIPRGSRRVLETANINAPKATTVVGPSRTETSIRSARAEVNRRPGGGSMRRRAVLETPSPPRLAPAREVRGRPVLPEHSVGGPGAGADPAHTGHRERRQGALTEAELYVDDARPPPMEAPQAHHVCSICHDVKSHPVSYKCGHSHCYVCIRMWLEKKGTCPECSQVMSCAPFRHYGEEQGIEHEYPDWQDDSRVFWSWDGLVFPRARVE
ncbi:hypothetical protein B0H11DRAFT_2235258 [Mycena galericulata]|nr:hypothetical protein B0H11DRAFT_2235258 [Mycena galericulata]